MEEEAEEGAPAALAVVDATVEGRVDRRTGEVIGSVLVERSFVFLLLV